MRHLLAEERSTHGTWYTSYFFRNTTFLFVKIESWNFVRFQVILHHKYSQNFSFLFEQIFFFVSIESAGYYKLNLNSVRCH